MLIHVCINITITRSEQACFLKHLFFVYSVSLKIGDTLPDLWTYLRNRHYP